MLTVETVPLSTNMQAALEMAARGRSRLATALLWGAVATALMAAFIAFAGLLSDAVHYLLYEVAGFTWDCPRPYRYWRWTNGFIPTAPIFGVLGVVISQITWRFHMADAELARQDLAFGTCEAYDLVLSREALSVAMETGQYIVFPQSESETGALDIEQFGEEARSLEEGVPAHWRWCRAPRTGLLDGFAQTGEFVRLRALTIVDEKGLAKALGGELCDEVISMPFANVRDTLEACAEPQPSKPNSVRAARSEEALQPAE